MKKGIINKEWMLSNGTNPYLGPGGCLNEIIVRFFYKQLVSAIEYIHKKKIIHRDIKPQNIMLVQSRSLQKKYFIDYQNNFEKEVSYPSSSLPKRRDQIHLCWQESETEDINNSIESLSYHSLTDQSTTMDENGNHQSIFDVNSFMNYQYLPVLKLVDFGLAFQTKKSNMVVRKGHVGTLQYMAPEVVNGIEATYNSDLWSIGATLYECITGECPYRNRSRWKEDKREKNNNEIIRRPQIQEFSFEMKHVVSEMLSYHPEERSNYGKYNDNLFNYLPYKCITDVKSIEWEWKKEEERSHGSLNGNKTITINMTEKDKRINENLTISFESLNPESSCTAHQQDDQVNQVNQVKEIAHQSSLLTENDTEDNNVYMLMPTSPSKIYHENSKERNDPNSVIIVKNSRDNPQTLLKEERNNNSILSNQNHEMKPSTNSHLIKSESPHTSVKEEGHECITIHQNPKSNVNVKSLFKSKKQESLKGQETNSLTDYSFHTIEEDVNTKEAIKSEPRPAIHCEKQIQSLQQKQSPQQSQSSQSSPTVPTSSSLPKNLSNRKILMKNENPFISEIEILEFNDEETIPVNYPTIYRRKRNENKQFHAYSNNNEMMMINTPSKIMNSQNRRRYEDHCPRKCCLSPSSSEKTIGYIKDVVVEPMSNTIQSQYRNDDTDIKNDTIHINIKPHTLFNNKNSSSSNDSNKINIPKRQSKIYKFRNKDNHACSSTHNDEVQKSTTSEKITITTELLSPSSPSESCFTTPMNKQQHKSNKTNKTNESKKIRSPKQFMIKQSLLSKSSYNENPKSSLPPPSINDLITFNNINISENRTINPPSSSSMPYSGNSE
ncbi:hypothetical protein LY90DRAFT_667455, partial [Neocallimastix californiae]